MGISRQVLLWASENRWLRERFPRYRFAQRAVRRFMPGEEAESALEATAAFRGDGIGTVLTKLGENLVEAAEAERVAAHYLDVLDLVARRGLDSEVSVKPTQLGLDLDPALCRRGVDAIAGRAAELGNFTWIDMEGSAYVDATLELFRAARAERSNVGLCLQAYLRRTPADLEALLPLEPAIRLVKGAYAEPREIAFPDKRAVDEAYLELATVLLREKARGTAVRPAFATHDLRLIGRIQAVARELGIPKGELEFQMLFGIQRGAQRSLAREGYRMRVLISYGSAWFPWYMRRLAERPANVLFVLRSMVAG